MILWSIRGNGHPGMNPGATCFWYSTHSSLKLTATGLWSEPVVLVEPGMTRKEPFT